MIPFAALKSDFLEIPASLNKKVISRKRSFPYVSGLQLSPDNDLSLKRAMLNVVTLPNLRAAHIFHFDNECHWYRFESGGHPLAQAEINGQMMTAIESIQNNQLESLIPLEKMNQPTILDKAQVMECLWKFTSTDKLFFILVFGEVMYVTGNYFDESTLCRAILLFEKTDSEAFHWPQPDKFHRLKHQSKKKKALEDIRIRRAT